MQEVFGFLKKYVTYYLATTKGSQPHVRPFTSLNLYEGRIYFQTGKVKNVAHKLKDNKKIEIPGMVDGSWIRLAGEAVLHEDKKAQQAMLDSNPGLDKMYAAGDGNIEVYYIKTFREDICSFVKELVHYGL